MEFLEDIERELERKEEECLVLKGRIDFKEKLADDIRSLSGTKGALKREINSLGMRKRKLESRVEELKGRARGLSETYREDKDLIEDLGLRIEDRKGG